MLAKAEAQRRLLAPREVTLLLMPKRNCEERRKRSQAKKSRIFSASLFARS